ncbi:disintegrin and metalloproteinase domain-containing protein 12-like [Paramacrobiotus metropolitanus]|uniref:disintegrin and metalloproteinase domain-containing protein 12-like n=1 Tax=Paramacrobiotus metropolitanus TaxID=2943436 RepID=UPI002445CB7C|nr:disintegrin and metalloproteinase domain-containing protein 12-like [Paramacrobiotus metropolitanus]
MICRRKSRVLLLAIRAFNMSTLFWLFVTFGCVYGITGKRDDILDEFYGYERVNAVISPLVENDRTARSRRDVFENFTLEADSAVPSGKRLRFSAFGKDFDIALKLNVALVADKFAVTVVKGANYEVHHPVVEKCHYRGQLVGIANSSVAISICRSGITGYIQDGSGETYHLQPAGHDRRSVIVTRESDSIPVEKLCGVDLQKDLNATGLHFHSSRTRRSIKPPSMSNASSLYVELVLVGDKRLYDKYDHSESLITSRFIDIVNVVNALYWPLNIFVALIGVEIWSTEDKISIVNDSERTLNNFLKYRKEDLLTRMPNDNAYLVTAATFSASVVGKALKGQMCTYEFSGGIAKDHSRLPGPVGSTIAHEMGHNFGMEHDYTDCKCSEDRCIMTPASVGLTPSNWSSCSYKYLDDNLQRGIGKCLERPPKHVVGPSCGNGFLEDGEECDCGTEEYCRNKCCIASTCKLSVNSTCGHGLCCDMDTCSPKMVASVCRAPSGECDLPEYCDGKSGVCPDDVWKSDGTECKKGEAYCYDGSCNTHNDQCLTLWGMTGAVAENKCFELNVKGTAEGNCGRNRSSKTYSQCAVRDLRCGLLHCTSQVDRLALGLDTSTSIVQSFIPAKTTYTNCKGAYVDLGLSVQDPGMVPNGAKCGDSSMCFHQVCTHVSLVPGADCSQQCNGAGICNNLGHCHCNTGYGPPYCSGGGYGGSADSGPATDPSSYHRLRDAMLIIFLLVVPVLAAILFLYIARHRIQDWMLMRSKHQRTRGRPAPPPPTSSAPPPPKVSENGKVSGTEKNGKPIGRDRTKAQISVPVMQQQPVSDSEVVIYQNGGMSKLFWKNPGPSNAGFPAKETPPPLPSKPPKAVREENDVGKFSFAPNRSPPRDLKGPRSASEEDLLRADPAIKPVRTAPPPPPPPRPAGSSTKPATGSLKKSRPVFRPPAPPVSRLAASDGGTSHTKQPDAPGDVAPKMSVAEMARKFENLLLIDLPQPVMARTVQEKKRRESQRLKAAQEPKAQDKAGNVSSSKGITQSAKSADRERLRPRNTEGAARPERGAGLSGAASSSAVAKQNKTVLLQKHAVQVRSETKPKDNNKDAKGKPVKNGPTTSPETEAPVASRLRRRAETVVETKKNETHVPGKSNQISAHSRKAHAARGKTIAVPAVQKNTVNISVTADNSRKRKRNASASPQPASKVPRNEKPNTRPVSAVLPVEKKLPTVDVEKCRPEQYSYPCRDNEFTEIYEFIRDHLVGLTGGCMYISGMPGTGKTATVNKVLDYLRAENQLKRLPNFIYSEINGMKLADAKQAYAILAKDVFNQNKMAGPANALRMLDRHYRSRDAKGKSPVIVVVDEMDLLYVRTQKILYNLFEWPQQPSSRLIIVSIANTMDLPEKMLMARIESRLAFHRLAFHPYTSAQLEQVVLYHLKKDTKLNDDAMMLASKRVASISGDARRVLEICRSARAIAEDKLATDKSGKFAKASDMVSVSVEDIQAACDELMNSPKFVYMKSATVLEKAFLKAVVMEYERTGTEQVVMEDVLDQIRDDYAASKKVCPAISSSLRVAGKLAALDILFIESKSPTAIQSRISLNCSVDDVKFAVK